MWSFGQTIMTSKRKEVTAENPAPVALSPLKIPFMECPVVESVFQWWKIRK
jgi:hypothetical protein